jgi:cell division protein FtsN
MQASDLMTVGMFPSRAEAHVSRARLAAEGLEAIVAADDAGGYEPQLGLTNGVRLMVRAQYAALALSILEPTEPASPRPAPLWMTVLSALLAGILIGVVGMPVIVTIVRAVW